MLFTECIYFDHFHRPHHVQNFGWVLGSSCLALLPTNFPKCQNFSISQDIRSAEKQIVNSYEKLVNNGDVFKRILIHYGFIFIFEWFDDAFHLVFFVELRFLEWNKLNAFTKKKQKIAIFWLTPNDFLNLAIAVGQLQFSAETHSVFDASSSLASLLFHFTKYWTLKKSHKNLIHL